MKQELYRLYNGELSSILTADEGMMIVRNADGMRFGEQIYLGYRFENGNAIMEMPSDFHQEPFVEDDVPMDDSEPTPEELLERAKSAKIAELENYNDSDAVNEFTIQGNPMWLTFDERNRLQKAVDAKEAMGKTSMTKVWNGVEFPFPLATWKQMLAALEDYAFDCQNVTDGHKAAINALESIADVEAYEFSGYPEKLSFGE